MYDLIIKYAIEGKMTMNHSEYIDAINELLVHADIELLDLIFQLLERALGF
jgi:hypothetical protein